MIIKSIKKPKKFFEAVKRCKGKVELSTQEGDLLNLKSTLCQYLALTQVFQNVDLEKVEFELTISDESDKEILKEYIVEK